MVVTPVEEVVQQRIQPMDLGLLAEYLVELEARSMANRHGNVGSLVKQSVLQSFEGSVAHMSVEVSAGQQLERVRPAR